MDTHRIVDTRLHSPRRHETLQRRPAFDADRELVVNSTVILWRELQRKSFKAIPELSRKRSPIDIYTNAFKLRRMMREGIIDLLFASSEEKVEYAREQGYDAWHTPYGYHESLGELRDLERNIDVLFLGDTRPWRRKRLLRRLRRSGIDVTVRGSWHDSSAWGESRTLLLNRTKVLVHLQRYPGKLASKRFILAMANGAMIVSEPPYISAPFVNGVHYVEALEERMPDVIRHYLAHPAERDRIVRAANRLVTEELTFTRSMETMLDVIARRLESQLL